MSDELLPASPGGYPVRLEIDHQERYSRLLPLVKWLLAVPHYIALFVLGIGALGVAFVAFFAVLITARYPRSMWDFMIGVHRWALRVAAYLLLMTDRYPPFTLAAQDDDPVRLAAVYPERVERWRPLLQWLLILPYAIVASILYWLAGLITFFAFFTILFTRSFPEGMFKINRVAIQWHNRANLYANWLTRKYPPFEWE